MPRAYNPDTTRLGLPYMPTLDPPGTTPFSAVLKAVRPGSPRQVVSGYGALINLPAYIWSPCDYVPAYIYIYIFSVRSGSLPCIAPQLQNFVPPGHVLAPRPGTSQGSLFGPLGLLYDFRIDPGWLSLYLYILPSSLYLRMFRAFREKKNSLFKSLQKERKITCDIQQRLDVTFGVHPKHPMAFFSW